MHVDMTDKINQQLLDARKIFTLKLYYLNETKVPASSNLDMATIVLKHKQNNQTKQNKKKRYLKSIYHQSI